MVYTHLSVDEAIHINAVLLGNRSRVVDLGALEAAIGRPFQSFGDVAFYGSIPEQAATLLQGIAANHPFVDGNKRTAWLAATIFLARNGFHLHTVPAEVAGSMVVDVVTHDLSTKDLALWFISLVK